MAFEGLGLHERRIEEKLKPALCFVAFLKGNFKFGKHIRSALTVLGLADIGINTA